MRYFALATAAAVVLSACATPSVEAQSVRTVQDELAAYPQASAGQKRHVLILPEASDEDDLKVEIIVGQMQNIDCNNHSLGGQLSEEVVQGWGYNYYIVPVILPGAATLMGCPPGSNREAFVSLSEQTIVRYNSKLPVVVYTPDNAEVRYRFWRAGEVRELN